MSVQIESSSAIGNLRILFRTVRSLPNLSGRCKAVSCHQASLESREKMAPLAFLLNPDRLILVILVRGRLSDLVLGVLLLNGMKEKGIFLSLCPENSNGEFTYASFFFFWMRVRFLASFLFTLKTSFRPVCLLDCFFSKSSQCYDLVNKKVKL